MNLLLAVLLGVAEMTAQDAYRIGSIVQSGGMDIYYDPDIGDMVVVGRTGGPEAQAAKAQVAAAPNYNTAPQYTLDQFGDYSAVPGTTAYTYGETGAGHGQQWLNFSGATPGAGGGTPAGSQIFDRPADNSGLNAGIRDTLSNPAVAIPLAISGATAGGFLTPDAIQPGVFGGQTLAGAAGAAIPGSSGQLLAQAGGGVSDSVAGGATMPPAVDWTQPFTSTTGVGAVSPGYAMPVAGTVGAAGGLGGIGTGAATGAAAAGAGAVLPKASSNDTPGEATVAPGVVNPSGTETGMNGALGSGLGGAAATGAASAGSAAALQRILAGGGTAGDYASILGAAAPGLLGAYASNQQTDAYKQLAQQQMAFGAPSRARFEASMAPNFDPSTIPGYTAALENSSQAILRKLSASGGNPWGSPGALIEANKAVVSGTALPAIQQYQNLNSSAGGLNTMAGAANNNASQAIGSNASTWNSLGAAAANVTAPPAFNLADYFRNLTNGGGSQNYALA